MKIAIPSNNFDLWARLEVSLGSKLCGQTITVTEPSNLKDELYKCGEKQNEQQYRNAPDNVYTDWMEPANKLLEQIASKTRSKVEEQRLIVIDKTAHEENLSQSLESINKK